MSLDPCWHARRLRFLPWSCCIHSQPQSTRRYGWIFVGKFCQVGKLSWIYPGQISRTRLANTDVSWCLWIMTPDPWLKVAWCIRCGSYSAFRWPIWIKNWTSCFIIIEIKQRKSDWKHLAPSFAGFFLRPWGFCFVKSWGSLVHLSALQKRADVLATDLDHCRRAFGGWRGWFPPSWVEGEWRSFIFRFLDPQEMLCFFSQLAKRYHVYWYTI